MKYLCLIYDEEKKLAGMSKSEGDAFMGEYGAFTESVKSSGHYLGGNALQPVHTATTIRSRNGKVSTTDGPFAETKEQLGGYLPDRSQGPQRRDPGRVADPVGQDRQHRGAADHGVQLAGAWPRRDACGQRGRGRTQARAAVDAVYRPTRAACSRP